MKYKNLTICSTDGFGSQYLKKMYGFGFCFNVKQYRYAHTPFTTIQHLSQDYVTLMNEFIGWEHRRCKIHVRMDKFPKCFSQPNWVFSDGAVFKIRQEYYRNDKSEFNSDRDATVIHIRRGDVNSNTKNEGARRRFTPNAWYIDKLKKIVNANNSKIIIHTFGTQEVFDGLYQCIESANIERFIEIRFNEEIRKVFHDMVSAKKFFMARSSLSYIAGILNQNEVFFQDGPNDHQSQTPLLRWKNWEDI